MKNKQILVVEDNELNREILTEILGDRYKVLEAENGQKALDILKKYKDEIALILLDVMMPVMDGYTFLKKMKAVPEYSVIPVIVMTQGDSEEDELKELAYGATDFVPKPYRPQIILHRVASIINLRETAALANQFKYDRLTGLYSKEFFCHKVRELLRENPQKEYDIICCNIENFKLFNDAFGVYAGDRLLRMIALCFTQSAGRKELVCRFWADRFVWLRKRSAEYDDEMFLESDRKISELPNAKNLSMKWGIYRITDRSVSVEQMCDRAIFAADSIKGQYLNQFAVYNEAMRDELLRKQEIIEDMETALEKEQFEVYFQPKNDLRTGKIAGAEALIRWNHPIRGMISPGEFIPLFEKNGFISRLDQFVWEKTCLWMKRWKEKGYPVLPVSVNVSRADFYQMDLQDVLSSLVTKYGLTSNYLHLEITESAYTENPKEILRMVEKLRKKGFIIELDDFGSGYSSLNLLNQMELDILKLDMGFIRSEMTKPADKGILRFIVELAHWKKLKVVAEGIEAYEQMVRIRDLGCEYAQGYYFARPMSGQDFEVLLNEEFGKKICDGKTGVERRQ